MLSRDQVELIQQEIDGANTPEGSAAVWSLMAQDPEARAMAAELRRVAGLFGQVAEREPPAGVCLQVMGGVRELHRRARKRHRDRRADLHLLGVLGR